MFCLASPPGFALPTASILNILSTLTPKMTARSLGLMSPASMAFSSHNVDLCTSRHRFSVSMI